MVCSTESFTSLSLILIGCLKAGCSLDFDSFFTDTKGILMSRKPNANTSMAKMVSTINRIILFKFSV
jgi:hypothetical protein